ncbi:MAG: protein kinase [Anaerolineae bacterium]|nr:protein kinase [Anaerolineae bacterium]
MDATNQVSVKGYELKERLGEGGFSVVYRATQKAVGREVAIKIILPGLANQSEFIRSFDGEAQIVARLEHPHITPLYDYWRDPQGAHLVMRWLRGGSLRDTLKKGRFELRAAALLLDQVAGALSLAHRNGVIHRDVKPGNILLDEDGNAYLTDFGIAKDVTVAGMDAATSAVVGSPDYIAPEQARGEPVTPRTDIYSLGVTMYEVLTGQHPFQAVSSVERLYKHINDPLPAIDFLEAGVAPEVNRVIQKATSKNPEYRYPDALAFAAEFRDAVGFNRTPTGVSELLTPREHEILHLIIDGLSNKEIAQRLTVALSTVKWYVNQIYGKLGVRSRVQAIVRGRELALIVRPGQVTTQAPVPTEDFCPKNPYKGLHAFQSADHQDFFGREKVTAKLVKRLAEGGEYSRFLAVVGPSGSGKSSLVKAGLIPALWRGDLPGSEKWFIVEMLPGARPLDELEVALSRVAANQAGNLREHLQRDKYGLLRAANLILPHDGSDLLLVIDQFEEVFTQVQLGTHRAFFLDLLYAAVTASRSRVRVLVTLRADFYDQPLLYSRFGELVRSRLETIMPLSADELERAIAKPTQGVGVAFEPGLVSSIVADVNYQPGALPLLQYALTELFERREGHLLTREAYQSIGGTVGALAQRADKFYSSLNAAERDTVKQMFMRLVTLGEGTEDTRRRTSRSELLAIASDPDMMDEIIDSYTASRLLSLDTDAATRIPIVEMAHEALLREWERLRAWLNEGRDEIRLQRQLAAMATDWHKTQGDASYLARGARLEQFEKWVEATTLSLSLEERTYLEASLAERKRQSEAESQRQARERLLERRSVRFLRALVFVLLLAIVGALGLTGAALNERNNAQRSAAESQFVALTAGSQAALATGNTDLAIALALEAVRLDPGSAVAQVTLSEAAYAPGTIRRFVGHDGAVPAFAISPDGLTVMSASDDTTMILWDIQSGQMLRRFEGHTDKVMSVAFSPDGRTVLSGSNNRAGSKDTTVILWDVQAGHIIRRYEGHTGGVWAVAFTPDGRRALSAGSDAIPILWDVETGRILHRLGANGEGHTDQIESLAISPDGRTALTGSWDSTLILWDLESGNIIRRYGADGEGHPAPVLKVAFSPDGRSALSGAQESMFILWDVATGEVIRRFSDGQFWVFGLAFSPDGRRALSAGVMGPITLWNVNTGEIIHRLRGHTGPVVSVAFMPDGHTALSSAGGDDPTLRLWDLEGGQIIRQLVGHSKYVGGVVSSPDGRYVFSTADDGLGILWDTQTWQEIRRFEVGIWGVDFSPDGKTVLLSTVSVPSGAKGELILVDIETGRERRRWDSTSGGASVAFSPDGRTAVSGGMGRIIILWDVATGQAIRRFSGYENGILDQSSEGAFKAAFSPDGSQVWATFIDGTIAVWNTATGERVRELPGTGGITGTFSANNFGFRGKEALVGLEDGTAVLWDVDTGVVLRQLTNHNMPLILAQISPDGRHGILSSIDETTTLNDLQTGDVIRRWSGAGLGLSTLAFNPDGRNAVLGFPDGRLELWRIDATLDELIAWTRANRYVPELTCEQREFYRLEPLCPATTPGIGANHG